MYRSLLNICYVLSFGSNLMLLFRSSKTHIYLPLICGFVMGVSQSLLLQCLLVALLVFCIRRLMQFVCKACDLPKDFALYYYFSFSFIPYLCFWS